MKNINGLNELNKLNEWDMIEVVLYNNDRINGVVDYVDKEQQLIHLKSANLWCGRINETFENLKCVTIDMDDIIYIKISENTNKGE